MDEATDRYQVEAMLQIRKGLDISAWTVVSMCRMHCVMHYVVVMFDAIVFDRVCSYGHKVVYICR